MDTPTTSQVSPRGHRLVSEGWRSRLLLMTRSARLCWLRSKFGPNVAAGTRLPRARPSHGHQIHPVRTRGASSAWNRFHAARRVPKLPEGNFDGSSPRSKRCETSDRTSRWNPASQRCCHRLDGPACLQRDRGEPSTTLPQLERAETHLHQDGEMSSGRRRIAEPTETSKLQTRHDRTPSPIGARLR